MNTVLSVSLVELKVVLGVVVLLTDSFVLSLAESVIAAVTVTTEVVVAGIAGPAVRLSTSIVAAKVKLVSD